MKGAGSSLKMANLPVFLLCNLHAIIFGLFFDLIKNVSN